MKITCEECDREVPYREINVENRFENGEFVTNYRCPYCDATLPEVTID